MAILFLVIAIFIFFKDLKVFSRKERAKVWFVVVIYIAFMFYYTSYINAHSYSVGYGIPGADMLAHFKGAKMLSDGATWKDLFIIAARFERVGLATIGYFIYTSFISVGIFAIPQIPIGINIYLIYLFQIFISIDTNIKLCKVLSKNRDQKEKITLFLILALCPPFFVQASQLMRDVYYMWFMAVLFEQIANFLKNKHNKLIDIHVIFIVFVLSFFCVLLRFYTVVIFVPLIFYFWDQKKISAFIGTAECIILLFGTNLVNVIKNILRIPWSIKTPELMECISFLLFPNVFNQSKYILHWNKTFGYALDPSGCNVPGIYYVMSLWNIWIFPLALIGLLVLRKKEQWDKITFVSILLATVLIYSITYDQIDTRHKFFMSIPLGYLATSGRLWIKNHSKYLSMFYTPIFFVMACFILLFSL